MLIKPGTNPAPVFAGSEKFAITFRYQLFRRLSVLSTDSVAGNGECARRDSIHLIPLLINFEDPLTSFISLMKILMELS
jgi:hypothetical protein